MSTPPFLPRVKEAFRQVAGVVGEAARSAAVTFFQPLAALANPYLAGMPENLALEAVPDANPVYEAAMDAPAPITRRRARRDRG